MGGTIDPPTPVGNIAATIEAPNRSITSNGVIQNDGNHRDIGNADRPESHQRHHDREHLHTACECAVAGDFAEPGGGQSQSAGAARQSACEPAARVDAVLLQPAGRRPDALAGGATADGQGQLHRWTELRQQGGHIGDGTGEGLPESERARYAKTNRVCPHQPAWSTVQIRTGYASGMQNWNLEC